MRLCRSQTLWFAFLSIQCVIFIFMIRIVPNIRRPISLSGMLHDSGDSRLSTKRRSATHGSRHNKVAPTPWNQTAERMIFVHVGKTGGETIKTTLRIGCSQKKTEEERLLCWRRFNMAHGMAYSSTGAQASILSQVVVGTMHWKYIEPADSMVNATSFLFTVRNPLDRLISWFRFINPENCHRDQLDHYESIRRMRRTAATREQMPKLPPLPIRCRILQAILANATGWEAIFFQQCFPTFVDFAAAFRYNHINPLPPIATTAMTPACSRMATDVLQRSAGPDHVTGHVGKHGNYASYYTRTVGKPQHSQKDIYVIRLEHLWEDLQSTEAVLRKKLKSYDSVGGRLNRTLHISHGSENFTDPSVLEHYEDVLALCCALRDEWWYYARLIDGAVNLGPEQKAQSIRACVTTCHVSSWKHLVKKCGWKRNSRKLLSLLRWDETDYLSTA